MSDDLDRELDEAPDEPAPTWEPEVGEKLIGRIRVKDTATSKFGDPQLRLIIERDDTGELVTVYGGHAVLKREFDEQQPQVGDRIGLKRLSDLADKNYKRYTVIVKHAGNGADVS